MNLSLISSRADLFVLGNKVCLNVITRFLVPGMAPCTERPTHELQPCSTEVCALIYDVASNLTHIATVLCCDLCSQQSYAKLNA